jgi:hypothetical protein
MCIRDSIKVVLATILTLALWKAYPPVFGARRTRASVPVAASPGDADAR